jgi:hypothetical protein
MENDFCTNVLAKDPALSGNGDSGVDRFSIQPTQPYFKSLETISFISVEFKDGSRRRFSWESPQSEHTTRASAWLDHYLRRRPSSHFQVRIEKAVRLCDLGPRARVALDDEQTLDLSEDGSSEDEWWE